MIFLATRNIFSPLSLLAFFNSLSFLGAIFIFLSDEKKYLLPLVTSLGMLFLGFGSFIAKNFFRLKPSFELKKFQSQKTVSIFKQNFVLLISLIALIFVSILITILFFIKGAPLLGKEVFVEKVLVAREGGWFYIRFLRLFLPLLLIICFVSIKPIKLRARNFLIIFLILYLAISFTLFGYRSYILNYLLLPIIILLGFLKKNSFKLILPILLLAFFSAFLITAIAYHQKNIIEIFRIIFVRMTSEGIAGLDFILHTLVPQEGFLYGKGLIMDFEAMLSRVGIIKEYKENIAQFVATKMMGENPYGWQAGLTLMGESYLNFGFLGLILVMFIFGFLFETLYIITLRRPKDTLFFPLNIYFQLSLLLAYGGPFLFMLLDSLGWLLIFGIFFLFFYIFFAMPTGKVHLYKYRFLNKQSI